MTAKAAVGVARRLEVGGINFLCLVSYTTHAGLFEGDVIQQEHLHIIEPAAEPAFTGPAGCHAHESTSAIEGDTTMVPIPGGKFTFGTNQVKIKEDGEGTNGSTAGTKLTPPPPPCIRTGETSVGCGFQARRHRGDQPSLCKVYRSNKVQDRRRKVRMVVCV